MSLLESDSYDVWNSKLFDTKEASEFIRGAVKTNPRKLKKKHVLSSFTWFR